jgi:hypothetical protein
MNESSAKNKTDIPTLFKRTLWIEIARIAETNYSNIRGAHSNQCLIYSGVLAACSLFPRRQSGYQRAHLARSSYSHCSRSSSAGMLLLLRWKIV